MDYILLSTLLILMFKSQNFIITKSIALSLCVIIFGFWFVCDRFTGNGVTDSVYYHLLSGVKGTSLNDIKSNIAFAILFSFTPIAIITFAIISKKRKIIRRRLFDVAFAFGTLLFITNSTSAKNVISSLKNLNYGDSEFATSYYKKPNAELRNKYNFVFIYAESLEHTFRNLDGINYLPEITKIANESLDFTDIRQHEGSGWTMAGLVNTQCGIPFTLPQGNSASSMSKFLSSASCIGEYLQSKGYTNEFIRGSDKEFAGGDKFLSQHGWNNIFDKEYFVENGLADETLMNGWGVHDDILIEHAYNEFERLSAEKQNFMLSFLTVNTHAPSGQFLPVCDGKISENITEPMLKAVSCSDYLLSQFIKRVMSSQYADKTIIVLVSDHYMMANDISHILNRHDSDRRNNFIIIKKDISGRKITNQGTLLDVWPTILAVSGEKNTDVGFGRNLLKKERSEINQYHDENNNINPFLAYSANMWAYPNIDSSISSDGNVINISNSSFKLPMLASLDNKNNIKSVYFNTFALDVIDVVKENSKLMYVTQCEAVNNIKNKVCLYILSDKNIKKKIISYDGSIKLEEKPQKSIIFNNEFIGVSVSSSGETGIKYEKLPTPILRGVTFFAYDKNSKKIVENINYDTCENESLDDQRINLLQEKYDTIIYSSNDSAFCNSRIPLSKISDITNNRDIENVGFRQQFGGVMHNGKANTVIAKPGERLDFFINKKTSELISLCEIFDDCKI